MNANVEAGKALLKKQLALDHQRAHGGSFARAWAQVESDHPELSEEYEATTASAAARVYRFIDRPARPRHETLAELSRRIIEELPEEQVVRVEA